MEKNEPPTPPVKTPTDYHDVPALRDFLFCFVLPGNRSVQASIGGALARGDEKVYRSARTVFGGAG